MNIVSNNKNRKVFLSSNTKLYETSKVDIILSPEFYWVRILDIPVKTISQAKAVLPTLFEDLISKSTDLSYQVIKLEDNKYLCFAYLNQKIYETIKHSGLNLSLVNGIYFAQNECTEFRQFIVDGIGFLYTQDNILVKIPNEIISDKVNLNEYIHTINLSSNKIDIKLYNNYFNKKQLNILIIIFVLISIINFIKYISYSNEISKENEKIEEIKKKNNLPSSMIQVDSIINTNKKIAQMEIKKREALEYLFSNGNFEIKHIELDKDILNIDFLNVDKAKIEEFISKKFKIISSGAQNLTLTIKVQL